MTTVTASPITARDAHEHPQERTAAAKPRFRFDDVSMMKKLAMCFATIFLLTLVIAAVGYFGLSKISGEVERGGRMAAAATQASQLNTDVAQAQLHAERYRATGRTGELVQARAYLQKARQQLAGAGATPGAESGERATALESLGSAMETYSVTLAALEADRDGPAAATLPSTGDSLLRQAGAVKASLDGELATMRGALSSFMSWTRLAIVGLVVLWAIDAVAVLRQLGREISSRLKRMTHAMLRLAEGKEITVPDLDRVDEFGDMARSLEIFRKGYLKLDRLRAEQAEQQHEKEEMRNAQAAMLLQLADQFERTVGDVVGGVAAASSQLQLTASSMASAAEHSAHQTTEVSAALSEASGGVTAAAAASDEFAMSIGEISRQAATAAELARKATVSAADADATISALANSAQQVGQIVELISTIAQRTNLLALNASIEAARGGEAGRGFAVVASEVKELAAQTSKATDAVAGQIRAIQDSTGASVSALKAIGHQVQQLEATSVSIAAAVDQQSVAGQDLARSNDLAARSTDDVSSNIVQVRETSLATGAAASQVLTSSTELEQQAVVLKAQVEEFLTHVRAA
jgi:methyl-accepting chemotaxis protein